MEAMEPPSGRSETLPDLRVFTGDEDNELLDGASSASDVSPADTPAGGDDDGVGEPYQRPASTRDASAVRRREEAGKCVIRMAEECRGKLVLRKAGASRREFSVPEFLRGPGDDDQADPAAIAGMASEAGDQHTREAGPADALGESDTLPLSSAAFDSPEGTVIIFDWDDTLFPTWFVTEVLSPCLPEASRGAAPPPEDAMFSEALRQHAGTVVELLRTASAIGRVGIVTLSQRPWVLSSAKRYMLDVDFAQLFKELTIPIIYARECIKRPMITRAEVEEGVNVLTVAKQAAMAKALKKLYGKAAWRNIISIGDSIVERDAIKELLWSLEQESTPRCKTVKLMEEPSIEQLGAELVLLQTWMQSMVKHEDDFDIIMDASEEAMQSMNQQFSM